MARKTIQFTPTWQGPIENYVLRHVRANVWRTLPELDGDDLYQEAYLVFMRICDRYPEVGCLEHFLGLFIVSWKNRLHQLASDRTAKKEVRVSSAGEDDTDMLAVLACGIHQNDVELRENIERAPLELRLILREYYKTVCHPGEVIDKRGAAAFVAPTHPDFAQQTSLPDIWKCPKAANDRLCRIYNLSPDKVDLVGQLRKWLIDSELVTL